MKKVIREGVFETNSSSTHAVAFKKRKGNQTEKDSSYELHTPFFKTLFIIGLCTHAKKFAHAYELDIELDLKEILGEDYDEEHCQAHECEKIEGYEGQCEKFKNAVIKEFIKMENITQAEFDKRFNESDFVYEGECDCRNFFDDDVLNDCTCPFDCYYSISKAFGLDGLTTEEEYLKKAKEVLSEGYKFVLQEYWQGCCLITKREIY